MSPIAQVLYITTTSPAPDIVSLLEIPDFIYFYIFNCLTQITLNYIRSLISYLDAPSNFINLNIKRYIKSSYICSLKMYFNVWLFCFMYHFFQPYWNIIEI